MVAPEGEDDRAEAGARWDHEPRNAGAPRSWKRQRKTLPWSLPKELPAPLTPDFGHPTFRTLRQYI